MSKNLCNYSRGMLSPPSHPNTYALAKLSYSLFFSAVVALYKIQSAAVDSLQWFFAIELNGNRMRLIALLHHSLSGLHLNCVCIQATWQCSILWSLMLKITSLSLTLWIRNIHIYIHTHYYIVLYTVILPRKFSSPIFLWLFQFVNFSSLHPHFFSLIYFCFSSVQNVKRVF